MFNFQSAVYTFYAAECKAALLHAADQYIKQ